MSIDEKKRVGKKHKQRFMCLLNWLWADSYELRRNLGPYAWVRDHHADFPGSFPIPPYPPERFRGTDIPEDTKVIKRLEEVVAWHGKLHSWMNNHETVHGIGAPICDPPELSNSFKKTLDNVLEWWWGEGECENLGAIAWMEAHSGLRTFAKDRPIPDGEPPPPPAPWGEGDGGNGD